MFKTQAGVDILHVPYRGAGPAVNDVVGGHIDLTFVGLGAVRSALEAGLVKVLAVAQPKRLAGGAAIPDFRRGGAAWL